LKHAIIDNNRPKNYNDFDERHAYAKKQLAVIENYAQDFKEIVNGLKNDRENADVRQMLQKNAD